MNSSIASHPGKTQLPRIKRNKNNFAKRADFFIMVLIFNTKLHLVYAKVNFILVSRFKKKAPGADFLGGMSFGYQTQSFNGA
jgi:hypothetical protein